MFIMRVEMLLNGIKPPLAFSGEQGHPATPFMSPDLVLRHIILINLAAMLIHIRNRPEQTRFTASRFTGQADTFPRRNGQVDRLNIRDFMETMRSSGMQSGGPPPLNNQDKQQFANQLDRLLAKAAS